MAAYAHDTSFFSRRALVFAVIVALHVFLAWAFATGLAQSVVEIIAPPIKTEIIDEIKPQDTPPPPPPPEFERPPVEVPPPEVAIDIPQDVAQSTAITDVTDKPVPKAPPPPPAPKNVKKAGIDPKRFPPSEEYYPAASKRLGEEGSPTVKACVGPGGKLSEEPSISASSGNARLDEAAIKYAKAGRYIAGSVDGQPTTDCFVFRVKFELKN